MMLHSVVALVACRNCQRDALPLRPGEGALPVHELSVEIEVMPHDLAVHAMDLQDVILVRHPILRGYPIRGQVVDVGHAWLPRLGSGEE
jgi:hypothetical protein